ncbi:phosphoribosylanthranilate isomerase [Cohnella lubricantis]|uniref:N-(5'-phosphoribosyl)anthranilate isomerase n=2 Tax=Cohnella lubricantis TaxID=2163172 RepID=A0A841TEV9_9BACL|nr:phosphoribosylanthranilate isomerase [Cohnella lubricantis]MBB6677760.1 phosphoribosylanthranilate isomerase [Cohnella lubricantis]
MPAAQRASSCQPRPFVKICGIQDERTLMGMDGLTVDYIGFVFAKSKRQVTPEQAASLLAAASRTAMAGGRAPRAVGVFVNPTMDELAAVLEKVELDVIQLHGQEPPAFCREVGVRFGVEVWRALPAEEAAAKPAEGSLAVTAVVSAGDAQPAGPARLAEYAGAISAVLLDTAGGGTGRAFRWNVIPAYQAEAARFGLKLFVAGGLTPDNVEDLISQYAPDGVDISSGVETDGAKDNAKIAAFAERVNK